MDELKKAYHFDDLGLYDGIIECQRNPRNAEEWILPGNSTFIEPPTETGIYKAHWTGSEWELIEDHRRYLDETGTPTGGTAYWLPGDTWQTPARYMETIGPLPENSTTVAPEKPENEIKKEEYNLKLNEYKQYLAETDYAIIKCLEKGLSLDVEYPNLSEKRQQARDEINSIQAELDSLS